MNLLFDADNPATIVSGLKKGEQCCKRHETRRWKGGRCMLLDLPLGLFTRCSLSMSIFNRNLALSNFFCRTRKEPIKISSHLPQSTFHNSFERFHQHGKFNYEQIHIRQATSDWRRKQHRIHQNVVLVWIDGTIDPSYSNWQRMLGEMEAVVNTIQVFTSFSKCHDYHRTMEKTWALVISSGWIGRDIVPKVHGLEQVDAIYIFCGDTSRHTE
jgi:hypothetical protein